MLSNACSCGRARYNPSYWSARTSYSAEPLQKLAETRTQWLTRVPAAYGGLEPEILSYSRSNLRTIHGIP